MSQLKEIASIDEAAENLTDATTTDETARDNLDSILQPALRNMFPRPYINCPRKIRKMPELLVLFKSLGFIIFLTKRHRMV